MPAFQRTDRHKIVFLAGIFTFLIGSTVLAGWAFGIPLLTRINPDWIPMVPGTALCFVLSGLSLLGSRESLAARMLVWLTMLLAGAMGLEIAAHRQFAGIDFLALVWGAQFQSVGHMSPQTVTGFLGFGIGMLSVWRAADRKMRMVAGTMAALLLAMGLTVIFGYWLKLQYLFETIYIEAGLIWMSLPTAVGMTLLGAGLMCLAIRCEESAVAIAAEQRARQIYHTTVFVVILTSVAVGLTGIWVLEKAMLNQATLDMQQSLNARRSQIEAALDDRIERTTVASQDPELKSLASLWFGKAKSTMARDIPISSLLAYGFSGIGLEDGTRSRVVVGRLVSDKTAFSRLNRKGEVYLAWDNGYYLRVLIPVKQVIRGVPEGFMVFEQELRDVNRLFDESSHWGNTGTMPMCSRLDRSKLLCFPQREQVSMYVIPDTFNGKPLPMMHALAGESGIFSSIDYRGRNVLSAYGPVGNTGLGLVLKMDVAEVYAPVKRELLIALPLIAILVALGLWITRLRVSPLTQDLANAHASERIARARFEAARESSPDGFVIGESMKSEGGDIVDFRYIYANSHAAEMARLPVDGLVGHSLLELFPEQRDIFDQYRKVVLTGNPLTNEFSLASDGATQWYQRQTVAMPGGIAVTFRNITQEKRLFQQLEYSNRLRTAIVENAAYSIISTDIDGTILTFNKAAERMLWYDANEVVGKAKPLLFHDADEIRERAAALSQELGCAVPPDFEVFVAKARKTFQEEHEWTYIRKDGSRFPVHLSVSALRDENDVIQGFIGIAYDISEEMRAKEYIRHIALHDVLTGLPNRALLDDRIMVAIEQQHRSNIPFALGMMDIDRFKHINDSMGHHIGDRLLKEFVERVSSCLRPTDTLARMGGDEFVLLLSETDETGVSLVAGRIHKALMQPINVGIQEVHITSSIGFSICPRDGHDMNELLRCADVAMYWVKEHGRNGYKMYSREMDRGAANRLSIERGLHLAIESDGFSLFYQPIVDLKSKTVLGVEALLRMHNGGDQHVPPSSFIPLAEETGLILRIGQWVLEAACRDAKRMEKLLGVALKVAVNISPRQFMNGDLVMLVRNALGQASLESAQLELEITESVLMDERSDVATALEALHVLGVGIAIDDFGTGYSSLSYLKRYPISQLKIDQSFVRDVTGDAGNAALITAIIAMGHNLKIPVIAEGIETEEQLSFLVENQCDQGQGFYIGHPMPFDALLQWLVDDTRWSLERGSASS